ncbi:MAG: NUDIX domain-containing protein, partial [Lysobacter sp.]|nr:NUDIX domain-containing protein [Lysobacter sp.]
MAAAARRAADRARAAQHGRARSARTAVDPAADPLRPPPLGRPSGRRIPARGQHRAARALRTERAQRDRGDGRSRPGRVAGARLGAAVARRPATGAHPADRFDRQTLHRKGGFWVQCGGHLEPDDATLSAAALREATEESGIA